MRSAVCRIALSLLLVGLPASVEAQEQRQTRGLPDAVEVLHTECSVVVGLRDADLIKRAHPDLQASVCFFDDAGRRFDTFRVDYSHAATPSHVVFRKRDGAVYASVQTTFSSAGAVLSDVRADLPEPVAVVPRLKVLDEKAHVTRGTAFADGVALAVSLPDYASIATAELEQPPRTVDTAASKKRVTAEFNFPIAGQCAFIGPRSGSGSTKEHSIYVPLNSDLYDPDTGQHDSPMKYMAEIPVAPEWVAKGGDERVIARADATRIHMSTAERDVWRLGAQRITGNRKGLLGQTINSTAVDDDGNMYFAMQYRSPIRFNVKTAKWEAPPVNVYEFLDKHKPRHEDLPYPAGSLAEEIRTDFSNVILFHNRRIWIAPMRYLITNSGTGANTLMLAFVCSIPIEHWDDREAFEKAMHVNAVSYPGTPFSLWHTPLESNDHRRKLNQMIAFGDRICLLAYHYNYFWVMDLGEDGSTRSLRRIDSLNGQPVVTFGPSMQWVARGDEVLGTEVGLKLAGDEELRRAFLPVGGLELTETFPEKAGRSASPPVKTRYVYNAERSYGVLRTNKYTISMQLGLPWLDGELTVLYDVVSRLSGDPNVPGAVLERMRAASMGPEYYAVSTPGDSMEVLGAADYPNYHFGRYDCAPGAGSVTRTFLLRDMAQSTAKYGLPAGLGPYCHRWFREGRDDVLHYAGYTGVARLVYRRDGAVCARHQVGKLFHGQAKHLCLDGAPNDYIKWYRDMLPGLGDKVFLTGTNSTQRQGTAYSGGLMYYHRRTPNRLYKLSHMSRSFKTTALAGRLCALAGGDVKLDIFLRGNFSAPDAQTLPENSRPTNVQPHVFVYEDRGASGVHDLYGFSLTPRASEDGGVRDVAVSRNGLYLLVLMQDRSLLSIDIDRMRFVDAVRLPGEVAGLAYMQRNDQLLRLPDGTLMVCVYETEKGGETDPPQGTAPRAAVFTRVEVGVDGCLSLAPHVRCTFPDAQSFVGPMALLYDSEKRDGSYDLVIGPHSQRPEGSVKIIRDFLPPRTPRRLAERE